MLSLLLLAVGLIAVILAAFGRTASLWGLAGFALIAGGLVGWRAQRERREIRRVDPDRDMTPRELARLSGLAVAVVLLSLVVRSLAAVLA
jgi:hypothetical protein